MRSLKTRSDAEARKCAQKTAKERKRAQKSAKERFCVKIAENQVWELPKHVLSTCALQWVWREAVFLANFGVRAVFYSVADKYRSIQNYYPRKFTYFE